ncbi:response regulator transcription factor [Bacillaceae bacterium SIJ1]|uniref:response regulator n=1 Tax=Litoribacterium kuwaitense TaxID=1398745 RepID=UPI0013EA7FF5|nr:response regulator transcription factor [Litoribacterium kuwaitense]NGP45595.1 response regulator transcription factor [Litoribacterium kuwaitense]
MPVTKILIADDQPMILDGLKAIIASQQGMDVVGMAKTGDEALQLAQTCHPDVILLDIYMPGCTGMEALVQMKQLLPHTPVLLMTSFSQDALMLKAIEYGATGFLLKEWERSALSKRLMMRKMGRWFSRNQPEKCYRKNCYIMLSKIMTPFSTKFLGIS